MQMEAIDSSLISHRGHDPERQVMTIRFRIKTGAPGSLYEYGNVSAAIYAEACAHKEMTFGQYFQRIIKPDPEAVPVSQTGGSRNDRLCQPATYPGYPAGI